MTTRANLPYYIESAFLLAIATSLIFDSETNTVAILYNPVYSQIYGLVFVGFAFLILRFKPPPEIFVGLLSIRVIYVLLVISRSIFIDPIPSIVIIIYLFSIIQSIALITATRNLDRG